MTDLALAPGNWSLLSAARDSVVMMWDLRSFAKLATFPVYEVLEGSAPTLRGVCILRPAAFAWDLHHAARL